MSETSSWYSSSSSSSSTSSSTPSRTLCLANRNWLLSDATPGTECFSLGLVSEPFITVDQLKAIRKIRDDARAGKLTTTYIMKDLNDRPRVRRLLDLESDDLELSFQYAIGYRNLFHMSTNFRIPKRQWRSQWEGPMTRHRVFIRASTVANVVPKWHLDKLQPLMKRWDKQWHKSKAKAEITQHLEACSGKIRRVNKVIGIGLGQLEWYDPSIYGKGADGFGAGPYIQHLALKHVAQEISRLQGIDVKIIVQDPRYDNVTNTVLRRNFPKIAIVEDPEAFYEMDNHTLLLYFHMPFDVGAVALAVAGEGGLAGMMCVPINADHESLLRGKALNAPMSYCNAIRLHFSAKWEWARRCAVQKITEEHD